MAGVISPFDLRLIQDLSSVPGHQRLEKPGSLDGYEGGSLMWASSAGTIDLQNDSDSKRFLTKALGNILKLLHSPNGEFTRCSGKLLELLEAESATMESTSTPQGSPAPGPSPVAGEDHDQDVGEDDDGDATLACEQDRWHDAPASLISTFNMVIKLNSNLTTHSFLPSCCTFLKVEAFVINKKKRVCICLGGVIAGIMFLANLRDPTSKKNV